MIELVKNEIRVLEFQKFHIGLNWEFPIKRKYFLGHTDEYEYTIDLVAFMIGTNKQLLSDDYFVFYNNLTSPDKALTHSDDYQFCECPEDCEFIYVDLTKVNPEIKEIIFAISIYEANDFHLEFGKFSEGYIRINQTLNCRLGQEEYRYDLSRDISSCSSAEVCRLFKCNGEWCLQTLEIGHEGNLVDLIRKYINNGDNS